MDRVSIQKLTRVVIYPKDVQRITGKSERYGRSLLKKIKKINHKEDHQFVSTFEFSDYTGLPIKLIRNYLND